MSEPNMTQHIVSAGRERDKHLKKRTEREPLGHARRETGAPGSFTRLLASTRLRVAGMAVRGANNKDETTAGRGGQGARGTTR